MIIAITGQPHSGKSTLLHRAVDECRLPSYGFITREIMPAGATHRTGFELVSSENYVSTLAVADDKEGPRVSRYRVDLENLESFMSRLRDPAPGEIAYIDEIGQMELLSSSFSGLVERWIAQSNHILCTVSQVYEHPFIDQIMDRADHIITISEDSRSQALESVLSILSNCR